MQCPKCHFEHALQTTSCMRCGVVFAKYSAEADPPSVPPVATVEPPIRPEELQALRQKAHREFLCRAFAIPGALLLGWFVANNMSMLSQFIHMWAHEGGHAGAAWLCGYFALPTGWFTIISPERHRLVSVVIGAGVVFGGYVAWRSERWFWVAISAGTLLVLIAGTSRSDFSSHGLIILFGDAGAFVLSTIMMATFYARPESTMVKRQVRWGLLVLGAIAFMYGYSTWAGGYEKISEWLNDFDERGPSDLQQLTEMYGWTIGQMQARFLSIAHWCFAVLAATYAIGLWTAWKKKSDLAAEHGGAARAAVGGSRL
jgi:hypothetical protein